MITLVLIALTLVGVFVIVKLIDKFVPQKTKWIFTVLFWAVALAVGWLTYNSIMEPIHFKKEKQVRYAKVVKNLKDIREAQIAHRTVTGKYCGKWDDLVKFIDTAEFTIIQRRDSSIVDAELTARYGGVETYKDIVIIDTIGTRPVKDSIFKDDRYKTMMNVPDTNKQFDLATDSLEVGKNYLSVFEAKVNKQVVLNDLPEHLVAQEKETQAVDGVNGEFISVGSLSEVSTNGNWPRKYDKEDE